MPHTLCCVLDVVRPVTVAMDVVLDAYTGKQLLLQQVALVQEQHDRRLRKQLGRDDRLPEHVAVLEAVHAPVLGEALVEAGDGREEDDRVAVVKVRVPRGTLRERKSDDSQRTGYRPVGLGGGVG